MTATTEKTILVTGGSGVVGSAVLRELDGPTPYCLTYRLAVDGRIAATRVRGDVRHPRLGLDEEAFRALAAAVDAVVHCAAVTDFTADPLEVLAVNFSGTRNVIELARAADAALYYVSTAFVHRHANTREGEGTNAYVGSKVAAEELVRASGLPYLIVRPSVVMGDSVSGEISRFQGLHALAGAAVRNALPLLPLEARTQIDFVPQDFVARHVASLVCADAALEGSVDPVWISAGERAPTVDALLDVAADVAAEAGVEMQRPRLVAPDFVERLMRPAFLGVLPERGQRHFEQMVQLTRLFETDTPFPSSVEPLCARFGIDPVPSFEDAFRQSMRYWAERKGLLAGERAAA